MGCFVRCRAATLRGPARSADSNPTAEKMTTLEIPAAITAAAPADELLKLQLRVARRADVLAWQARGARDTDRRLWLRAEYEVLEWMERARPVALLGDRSLKSEELLNAGPTGC